MKRIAFCFDGTWDRPASATNVYKLYQAITTAQLGMKLADSWYQKVGYFWNEGMGDATTLNQTNNASYGKSNGWDLSSNVKFGDLTLFADYASTSLARAVYMPTGPKAWAVQLSNGKKVAVYMHVAPFVDMNKVGDQAWAIAFRSFDPGARRVRTARRRGFPSRRFGHPQHAVASLSMDAGHLVSLGRAMQLARPQGMIAGDE